MKHPQGSCCPRINLTNIGHFTSTTNIKATELLSYLVEEVGVNFGDYFCHEYPCALYKGEGAYDHMVALKKQGWTAYDLAHHHIYGFFVNLSGHHDALDKLGEWLDSLEDVESWVDLYG